MAAAKAANMPAPMLDRLTLDDERIEAMAKGVEDVAALPDPVGRELARWTRPNGLDIARVATPIGVIGIIYESRPNVTADAGALASNPAMSRSCAAVRIPSHSSGAIHAGDGRRTERGGPAGSRHSACADPPTAPPSA